MDKRVRKALLRVLIDKFKMDKSLANKIVNETIIQLEYELED